MKKVISLISSLALVISLSSCAIKETPIINGVEYKCNDQFYADTVDQLLTYIDDGDKDGVKSLLCNGLKNSDGIDADIQALIDGFEGDIIRTTEYEKDTVSASSSGKNYTSAFLSRSFYIITDKQKYGVYIAVCPIDEKHDDGEDLVGVYKITINNLDYETGDIECTTANNNEIWCYEPASGKSKLFKVSRITSVEVVETGWQFEESHEEGYTDVFHISSDQRLPVTLRLGMTAANLLIEEFPLAEKYMEREDDAHWLFHTEVCKYEGIGRFVLGLFEDIEIINSPDFVLYLKEKVQNISEKIQD